MSTDEQQSTYLATDPIISSNFTLYSPSSGVRQLPGQDSLGAQAVAPDALAPSESTPLLVASHTKKPFHRARPLWLVPFGIVASIARGMTLAPRVQVFTQLSCNAIYAPDVYDHTSSPVNASAFPSAHFTHIPFHASLDPFGPQLDRRLVDLSSLGPNSDASGGSTALPHSITTYSTSHELSGDQDGKLPTTPFNPCLSDPKVQSGAARIQTIMTTTMGTLSALTTGWWGHFGEQHGRTRVLAVATFGLFLTDLTFILVSTPHSPFAAYGHVLLIVSPIIEGLLGGWSTLQGATSAYISDCTSDGSRAQIFSRFTGVFYLGFSLGPAIGAYLIRHPLFSFPTSSGFNFALPSGQPAVTSVFYVAAMCSFINLLLVLFVFPESLDKKKAKGGKPAPQVVAIGHDSTKAADQTWIQRFLAPLALLMPRKIQIPEGGYWVDWSVTILGVALFFYMLATGIFQIKYLYAEHVYGWNAEQLSYYITFVGGMRAVHLLFIMPFLIATFKPKPKPKQPQSASTSVSAHQSLSSKQPSSSVPAQAKKAKPGLGLLVKEMNFDIMLLRVSFIIEFLSHALVAAAPITIEQSLFVAFTTLSCFGSGIHPAANSLALVVLKIQAQASGEADKGDDGGAGRLFGALASIQAVGQMIMGPLIFGVMYGSTVATFPKAIFVFAAAISIVAIVFLCFLRPDVTLRLRHRRVRQAEEMERGRSRASKDLSRSPPMGASSYASGSGSSPSSR